MRAHLSSVKGGFEMMEDVKKVLDAVARGEISPEEGEKLISALLEKEERGKKEKGKDRKKEAEFIVKSEEVIDGDVVLSGKRVLIQGRIRGDVVLIQCDLEFSGEVEGDLVLISGRAKLDGGRVGGDFAVIGAKVEGDVDEVKGDRVKISNFFINGIMMALSPILKGLSVTSIGGKTTVKGSRKVDYLNAREIVVDDELEAKKVEAKKVVVNGLLRAEKIEAEKLVVRGEVVARRIDSREIVNDGRIVAEQIRYEKLVGSGEISKGV